MDENTEWLIFGSFGRELNGILRLMCTIWRLGTLSYLPRKKSWVNSTGKLFCPFVLMSNRPSVVLPDNGVIKILQSYWFFFQNMYSLFILEFVFNLKAYKKLLYISTLWQSLRKIWNCLKGDKILGFNMSPVHLDLENDLILS